MTPTTRPVDRADLRAAQQALGAVLIYWPWVVAVRGHEGAAVRLEAWATRVARIEGTLQ
jgi:hypothetical protein